MHLNFRESAVSKEETRKMSSGGGVVVKTEEEEEDGPGFVFVRPEFSEGAMAAVSLNDEPIVSYVTQRYSLTLTPLISTEIVVICM